MKKSTKWGFFIGPLMVLSGFVISYWVGPVGFVPMLMGIVVFGNSIFDWLAG